jgi:hypothetical protein
MTFLRQRPATLADGIRARADPRIAQSCQQFIDMMGLRGTATTPRSANSIFVEDQGWQDLADAERRALANAVACRAFGKHARHMAQGETGHVFELTSGRLLATSSNNGVEFTL